ncbi:hypothetical protein AB0F40_14705, partial [Promicromonospora sp. NPDC023987]
MIKDPMWGGGAMYEGLSHDDGVAGALLDGSGRSHAGGEAVMVHGMLVRPVADGGLPPGEPPDDVPSDEAWFEEAWAAWATVEQTGKDTDPESGMGPGAGLPPDALEDLPPDSVSGWPPDGVPVVFWPEDVLREAVRGLPGARLARVVAEAVDVDGDLDHGGGQDSGLPGSRAMADLSDDALGDLVTACGRLQSWAAGVQARVVAERSAR